MHTLPPRLDPVSDNSRFEHQLYKKDPKAFTSPWTGKKVFKLEPDWQYIGFAQKIHRGRS